MSERVRILEREPKPSGSLMRLEETLKQKGKISLTEGKTVDQSLALLRQMMEADIKDKGLREVLVADTNIQIAKVMDIVWSALVPELIGRNLITVMTGISPVLRIPKAVVGKVYKVGQLGGAPVGGETYEFTDITPELYGVNVAVPRTLIEDASWPVIERQLGETSRAMAEKETEVIVAALEAAASTQSYATSVYDTMCNAMKTMGANNARPTVMACHPNDYWGKVMLDAVIKNWYQWGGQPTVPSGVVPQILGMKPFISTKVTSGTMLFVDPARVGVHYVRRDATLADWEDPINDLVGSVLTSRFGCGVLRANAVLKVATA